MFGIRQKTLFGAALFDTCISYLQGCGVGSFFFIAVVVCLFCFIFSISQHSQIFFSLIFQRTVQFHALNIYQLCWTLEYFYSYCMKYFKRIDLSCTIEFFQSIPRLKLLFLEIFICTLFLFQVIELIVETIYCQSFKMSLQRIF